MGLIGPLAGASASLIGLFLAAPYLLWLQAMVLGHVYPKARAALIALVDEELDHPSRFARHVRALSMLKELWQIARDTDRAERRAETRTKKGQSAGSTASIPALAEIIDEPGHSVHDAVQLQQLVRYLIGPVPVLTTNFDSLLDGNRRLHAFRDLRSSSRGSKDDLRELLNFRPVDSKWARHGKSEGDIDERV